jgi:transcriptional regulator with XRE-family HTH domain
VTFATEFGKNLAHQRRTVGLSQEETAVRASLHRTAVGQIERGERVARVDTLVKLAGALGVDPCELLAGLSWQPGGTHLGSFEFGSAMSVQDRCGSDTAA